MITLNLLPLEYRKKKVAALSFKQFSKLTPGPFFEGVTRIPFRAIYVYGGGGLVILYTFVVLGILVNGLMLKGLKKEWERMAPEYEKAARLTQEHAALDAEERAVLLLRRSYRWSKKLEQLSDSMVGGVWLQELSLEERSPGASAQGAVAGGVGSLGKKERLLVLLGSVVSLKEDETALVGRFIRHLKENREFFEDFLDVELESIKRRAVQSLEVMDFKIICTFREGKVE